MSELVFVHANASVAVIEECADLPSTDLECRPIIYVDGALEKALGYDCVLHVAGHLAYAESQRCKVVAENGTMYRATLFLVYGNNLKCYCGFLVMPDDEDGMNRLKAHTAFNNF